jgi:hypothetical protein
MRRTLRSLATRFLVILAAAAAVAAAAPGIASAGGPTSVLLASPYSDSAAGLYYSDDDYTALQSLLGGPGLPGTSAAAPSGVAGAPYVTVTWLVHDVSVWRLDRIFLLDDDVWVVSETSADGGPLTGDGMYPSQTGNTSAVWHRSTDAAALTALLDGYGLTPGSGSAAGASSTDRSAAVGTAPAQQATPIPAPGTAWWWGVGGLLVGLAAGLFVGLAVLRLTAGRTGRLTGRRTRPDPAADPARMLPVS